MSRSDDHGLSPADLESRLSYYQNRALDAEARLAAAEARCAELEAQKNAALQRAWSAEASLSVRVGMRREFEEILGVSDTMEPGAFEAGMERLRALQAAETERDSYRFTADRRWAMRDELERLLGVGDTYGEEQFERGVARLRGLIAAESRAARYEAALREIGQHPCWLIKIGWGGTCVDMKAAGPCASCRARAALAGGQP
jgi:hypothetical protein